MYINTFKYTPKDGSCQLCTEYVKKLGGTALQLPVAGQAHRGWWSATARQFRDISPMNAACSSA